jgi:tRNA-specific adenosine deaminase 3
MEILQPQLPLDQNSQPGFFDILATDSEADETESQGHGDPNDILESDVLPFNWKKLQIDEEEENIEDLRTSTFIPALQKVESVTRCLVQAWVVDIPDSKHIATMLK